ncbi:OmpA family protein [Pedobacter borealis]|uniref:OmpA family protein n=1 Tax=Pedobacter borealis TaxID=475254 RepID=UPI00068FFA64|nr:OmpA family protein [Pedobacter borealis]
MKQFIYIFTLFIFGFGSFGALAQTEKAALVNLKQAKKEYDAMKYAATISLLEKAAITIPDHIEVKELLANSYRKTKDYKNALIWYEKLSKTTPLKPEWVLSYAEVLANNEKYKDAEIWYKKYLKMAGADQRALDFANAYSSNASFMKEKRRWQVYYTNLNTVASEYAPMFYQNGLLFVSNRKIGNLSKHIFGWDQSPFSDLYVVKNLDSIKPVDTSMVMSALKAKQTYKVNDDDTRNTSNDNNVFSVNQTLASESQGMKFPGEGLASPLSGFVNTKYHEGPATVLPDGSLIFTRNNYFKGKLNLSKTGVDKLKIFTASTPSMDDLKPFPYNNDEYSTGHPAVNKAGTILIFSSDMPGGKGGVDLYVSTRANFKDEWGKPVNLGNKVNTEGDEMFPTLYNDSTLFFSSTGHAGLGGLDIFEIPIRNAEIVGVPLNLGAPVNSSSDDFSFIRSESGYKGFFSSNRLGTDDIYGFQFQPYRIKLQGVLTDNLSHQPIANAQIQLSDNGVKTSFYTDNKGEFIKELPKRSVVDLIITRPGYAFFSQQISTMDIDEDTTILQRIQLKSLANISKVDANKCDELHRLAADLKIYYDLDKAEIRTDAKPLMKKIALFLKANPQFELVASSFCDSRASNAYNIELSERRSKNAKQYLMASGIDAERIVVHAYGEDHLVNNCADGVACDEANQQLNRRTEFFIILNGKDVRELKCEELVEFLKK